MLTLLVIRTPEPGVSAELATAARALGDLEVLDLTGEAPLEGLGAVRAYRPEGGADFTSVVAGAHAIVTAAQHSGADLILTEASFAGRELAGYSASLLDAGVMTDASAIRREGDKLVVTRTVLAGSWTSTCEFLRTPAVVAFTPGLIEPETVPGAPQLTDLDVALPEAAGAIEILERTRQDTGDEVPLPTADIVVVGGRGVEGDFTLVRQLAERLGAAVGATRVATDEGWIEHTAQIGQTGVSIRPKIYIGLGVSGAVHHTVGMHNSAIVVAVNTDSEAPIFEMCDFGVVGDLNDVVPQLLEALGA
ncbi:MAG: electron transfer flavoprotein subunit alpha/FixB family protein [Bowdeniella nasicola]|nr:electron transfer flavoprotein subunit alpha/FixB family protein [Bowdeniella nasicola]